MDDIRIPYKLCWHDQAELNRSVTGHEKFVQKPFKRLASWLGAPSMDDHVQGYSKAYSSYKRGEPNKSTSIWYERKLFTEGPHIDVHV